MILILFLRINKICSNKRDSQAAAAASAASVFLPWPGLSFRTTRANFKDGSTTTAEVWCAFSTGWMVAKSFVLNVDG